MVQYDSGAHKTIKYGYQNPQTAKAFSLFVKKVLIKAKIDPSEVTIVGMDGSSTFLAAFCKMRMPEMRFESSSKYRKDTLRLHTKYLIFADDYFGCGLATNKLVSKIPSFTKPRLLCFYIAASAKHEGVVKGIRNKGRCASCDVFIMK